MNQLVTTGIVLGRTDYGEADRIITVLTPQYGKLTLMAKGVRKVKSKLAGGIELFSVSEITFVKGRGDMGTLISARLGEHFGAIVSDLDRTMLGYELIKQLNKATEDQTGPEYFDLLRQLLIALNDTTIPLSLIQIWFQAQLLRLNGHTPNLETNEHGQRLQTGQSYSFDFNRMQFVVEMAQENVFTANHIKFLRLLFTGHTPRALANVQGGTRLAADVATLIRQSMQLVS